MFQHSQQSTPLEFNYHADLLGVPLVLFRVFVSLLSLQPRHRPTPTPKPPPPASTHAIRAAALMCAAPHAPLAARRYPRSVAPACPLDLTPLAPYALHSVRLPPSPAVVSIMIMISISHPALLAPRASRSLRLLQLELFRSCFRFRLGRLSLVARICYVRSESIPDPSLFIPVLAFFRLDALASSTRHSLAGTPVSCFLDSASSAPLRLLN
ncbi:hypothetical protein B0H13DRAFT_2324396 [Mycena leptocephala]|nr:hypothetical protein B0H13DRAFT_2324396 [Mycena leptocephala]